MAAYNWLCPTELDRERLIASVHGVSRARAVMFLVLTALIAGSVSQVGPWAFIPLLVAMVVSSYLYRNLETRRRPELWAAAGWLVTQLALGAGIAVSGGPQSPALPWLAIAVVSLVARFNRVAIRVGMVFLFVLLAVVTVGVDPRSAAGAPASPLLTAGLLFSVWVFAEALLRSDIEHRDRDRITGLANEASFTEHLRLALQRRERRGGAISLLAVDLDGFSLVNESLGRAAGDALLRQAAARLGLAASSAELVARRSADEFLILTHAENDHGGGQTRAAEWLTPAEAARALGRSIQASLTTPLNLDGREVYLGACVGISVLAGTETTGDTSSTLERLYSHALLALSSARAAGPGSLMVYDSARPDTGSRLSLITRLRKAVDRGEFVMHYQPTVNLHTGEVAGVEALLRWQEPERGLAFPGQFMAAAEDTGLIDPIGAWVLEEVCRQARDWQEQGLDFDVAFNLSPRQLWQPDLVQTILAKIDETGVDRSGLVIEITESSALRDTERTLQRLHEMTHQGLRLALDDFGVGLSSLSRLHSIPAEVIKMDRMFVSGITRSPEAPATVQMIIQLAHKLGKRAHAEGVELEAQRRFLVESGCELGQGYLFGRPCPAKDIPELYLVSQAARSIPLAARDLPVAARDRMIGG